MNNTEFIWKIAPRGEGKTKWLVERAHEEVQEGNRVFLLTHDASRFTKFVEHYYENTHEICRVQLALSLSDLEADSVVLVDNLLKQNITASDIGRLEGFFKKVYITAMGKQYRAYNTTDDEWEQLTIFTMAEAVNA